MLKLHQLVGYAPQGGLFGPDARVQAIVRRCHRDGTYTVEARHFYRGDKADGCYLGFRYRLGADVLRAWGN